MNERSTNEELGSDEANSANVARSVDTTTTPRAEDLQRSDLPADVEEGNPFDPDGHTRRSEEDPRSGQVGPESAGNKGLSGKSRGAG